MSKGNCGEGHENPSTSPWLKKSRSSSLPFPPSLEAQITFTSDTKADSYNYRRGGNRSGNAKKSFYSSSENDCQSGRTNSSFMRDSRFSNPAGSKEYESTPYIPMPSFRINPHVASQPQLAQHAALTVHSGTTSDQGGTVLFFSSVQKRGGAFTTSEMETNRQLQNKQRKHLDQPGSSIANVVTPAASFSETKKLLNKKYDSKAEETIKSIEKEEKSYTQRQTLSHAVKVNSITEKRIHNTYGKRTRFDISSEEELSDE